MTATRYETGGGGNWLKDRYLCKIHILKLFPLFKNDMNRKGTSLIDIDRDCSSLQVIFLKIFEVTTTFSKLLFSLAGLSPELVK